LKGKVMKMRTMFLLACMAGAALAQGTQPQRVEKRVIVEEQIEGTSTPGVAARRVVLNTGGQTMEFISGVNVGPTVTKAPYAAEAVNESVQTLYDGNRIVERSTSKQYRDSEGRERREEGALQNVVFISDPVAKISYTLHPETKTAQKMALQLDPGNLLTINHAPLEARTFAGASGRTFSTFSLGLAARSPNAPNAKEEDLGTRMIEGVEAKGSRSVTTIPAGEIGNDRAIEIVDERWYSPELQVTILTRHTDPRMGETTYKLVNIQRIEQVRSLFEVPPGYNMLFESIGNKGFKEEE
jgi:hypothetical protein